MCEHVRKVRIQNMLKYVVESLETLSSKHNVFQNNGKMTPTYCTRYLDPEKSTERLGTKPLNKDHPTPHEMMVDVEGPHFQTYCSIL